jgi:hypothetical protein
VVGRVLLEVLFLAALHDPRMRQSCERVYCALVSVADVEISGRASYKISPRSLEGCSKNRMAVLCAGIRGLSQALMETAIVAPTDTKVSPIPSSNCFASTLQA